MKTVATSAVAATCTSCNIVGNIQKVKKKPNIIFICTDQQSASMMSCAGNKWLKTPAMDYIAENGIRFTRAYSTNPVCSPARVSMITGRFAASFNDNQGNPARENHGSMKIGKICDEVKTTTIAAFLQKAGYDLVYGGKEHLPQELTPKALGFQDICDDEREKLAEETAKYIKSKHDKPYYMVVSLINPHDICYMAIRDFANTESEKNLAKRGKVEIATLDKASKIPDRVSEDEFFEKYCPPLPPNYPPQKDEPKAIDYLLEQRNFRRQARDKYTDRQWRHHRWAYCRLTEFVDSKIQTILDAIKQSGNDENTLVIFSSDHGDNDASHHLEHKTTFYQESANIPFLAMWKGQIPPGQVDNMHLVSNGLDLLPTVCDYAGIHGVSDTRGKNLRPLFEGKYIKWRDTLGVESEIGRMVVSKDNLKYIKYDAQGLEEQLLDLNSDPHETTHFTDDPKYTSKLNKLRKSFETEWFPGH
ncbi:MAG: sulfatase-like hydrolase/transferase [Sedimentisphaerales bacterium]|nr:sulfatase-like hydrolase/transferase [Sedimentisphaerales bacterium]